MDITRGGGARRTDRPRSRSIDPIGRSREGARSIDREGAGAQSARHVPKILQHQKS